RLFYVADVISPSPTPPLSLHDALPICRGVQVQPVPRLVLHLGEQDRLAPQRRGAADPRALRLHADDLGVGVLSDLAHERPAVRLDRKSTRLNSSHVKISYAVFRLNKKK